MSEIRIDTDRALETIKRWVGFDSGEAPKLFEAIKREAGVKDDGCLPKILEALGWQGGTIHQAIAEIKAMKAVPSSDALRKWLRHDITCEKNSLMANAKGR